MNSLLVNLLTGTVLPNLVKKESCIIGKDRELYFVYNYKDTDTGILCTIVAPEGEAHKADDIHSDNVERIKLLTQKTT